jgi:hypothetical protein
MDDLVQWLGAQLDEDERIARAAAWLPGGVPGEQWRVSGSHGDAGGIYWSITNVGSDIDRVPTIEMVGSGMSGGGAHTEEVATHIAAHDPARVLREIDADRMLLAGYEKATNAYPADSIAYDYESEVGRARTATLAWVVRLRAARFADRPGYREEWAPAE